MTFEADAVHIPHLPLEPVGDRPDTARRRDRGVVLLHRHLLAQPVVVVDGVEVVADVEAGTILAPGILEVVDRCQVDQHVEPERSVVAAKCQRLGQGRASHYRRVIAAIRMRVEDARAETLAHPREDRLSVHWDCVLPAGLARYRWNRWMPAA